MFEGELSNGHSVPQCHRVEHHSLYLSPKFEGWRQQIEESKQHKLLNYQTIKFINLYLMFEGELIKWGNAPQYHRLEHHLLYLPTKFEKWKCA